MNEMPCLIVWSTAICWEVFNGCCIATGKLMLAVPGMRPSASTHFFHHVESAKLDLRLNKRELWPNT